MINVLTLCIDMLSQPWSFDGFKNENNSTDSSIVIGLRNNEFIINLLG